MVYAWIPVSIVATTFVVGVTAALVESGRLTWLERRVPVLRAFAR